jgi:hypothetical protein
MQNPFQQMNSGSMDGMNDPLGFVKKLWGDMQLPGMVTPTLSVDELDKQIKDLKTVESWLAVNMNLLKGTIHALEVQRATIAALKTMGESFSQAASATNQTSHQPNPVDKSDASTLPSRWPMPEAKQAPRAQAKQTAVEPAVEDEEDQDQELDVDMPPETPSAAIAQKNSVVKGAATPTEPGGFSNPAGWWTVLQDQFKQALTQAMSEEEPAKSASSRTTTKAKLTVPTVSKPAQNTKNLKTKPVKAVSASSKIGTKPTVVKQKISPAGSAGKVTARPSATRKPKEK